MRTTAVYANGKFGLADRSLYASRPELTPPYQIEMLTVYLIREFSLDLVDHLAKCKAPNKAAKLDRKLKRHLGMGNATGLGMAPFLVDHPLLIHKWFESKEIAFSRVRSIPKATNEKINYFINILSRSHQHLCEWNVEDKRQNQNIKTMRKELNTLIDLFHNNKTLLNDLYPWDTLYKKVMSSWSIEGIELLVALILEPYPEIVDELGDSPDMLFIPVGNAGNITSYWKGFKEYNNLGKSTKNPNMMGFQAEGAAPIVKNKIVEFPETFLITSSICLFGVAT